MKVTEPVCNATMSFMAVKRIAKQGVTHPFGDHRAVKQAFPAALSTAEADPFLMCDYFNIVEEDGPVTDPDDFPVGWHPHRGFDICSYFKSRSFGATHGRRRDASIARMIISFRLLARPLARREPLLPSNRSK